MAQNNYVSLVGRRVRLKPGANGPFRACYHCEGRLGIIGKGISSHPGQLSCDSCGRHLSWLGAKHLEALLASESDAA